MVAMKSATAGKLVMKILVYFRLRHRPVSSNPSRSNWPKMLQSKRIPLPQPTNVSQETVHLHTFPASMAQERLVMWALFWFTGPATAMQAAFGESILRVSCPIDSVIIIMQVYLSQPLFFKNTVLLYTPTVLYGIERIKRYIYTQQRVCFFLFGTGWFSRDPAIAVKHIVRISPANSQSPAAPFP